MALFWPNFGGTTDVGRSTHSPSTGRPSEPGGRRSGRMRQRRGVSYGPTSVLKKIPDVQRKSGIFLRSEVQLHIQWSGPAARTRATGLGEAGGRGVIGATQHPRRAVAGARIWPPARGPPLPPPHAKPGGGSTWPSPLVSPVGEPSGEVPDALRVPDWHQNMPSENSYFRKHILGTVAHTVRLIVEPHPQRPKALPLPRSS